MNIDLRVCMVGEMRTSVMISQLSVEYVLGETFLISHNW